MLFQKGERMEIKEYYAKPEQTIEEHVTKLLDELEILKKYGENRIDVTIGSALDLFGGTMNFSEVLSYCGK